MVMGFALDTLVCCFKGGFPVDEAPNDKKQPAVSASCLNAGRHGQTGSARPAAASLQQPWNLYLGTTPTSALSETEYPVAVLALDRSAHVLEPNDVVLAASLECVYINNALRKYIGAPSPQAYRRLVFEELLNVEMNLLLDIRDTLFSLSSPVCHTPLLTVTSVATSIKGSFEAAQPQSHPDGYGQNTSGFPPNDRPVPNEANDPPPGKMSSPPSLSGCQRLSSKNARNRRRPTINTNTGNSSSYPTPPCNHSPGWQSPPFPDLGLEGLRLHPCWVHDTNSYPASTMQSTGVMAGLEISATATTTASTSTNGRRPGVVLWHRQPLSFQHSRAVALRSLGLLSNLDSAITLIARSGRVVYQNAASRRYYGRLLGLGPDTGSPIGGGLGSPGAPHGEGVTGAMVEEESGGNNEAGNQGLVPLRRALTDTDTDGGVPWAGDTESILRGLSETRLLGRLFACEMQSLVHDMLATWAAGRAWKRLLHVPPAAGPYGNCTVANVQLHKPPLVVQGPLWQPPPSPLPAPILRAGIAPAMAAPVSVVDLSVAADDLSVQVLNAAHHSAHDSCVLIGAEGSLAASAVFCDKLHHSHIIADSVGQSAGVTSAASLSLKSTVSLMPITPPTMQQLSPLPFPSPPPTSRPSSPQLALLRSSSKPLLPVAGRPSSQPCSHHRASRMNGGIPPTPSATPPDSATDFTTAANFGRPLGTLAPSGAPAPTQPSVLTASTLEKSLSPAMSANMESWVPGHPSGSGYTCGDRNASGSGGGCHGPGVLSSAVARLQSGATLLMRGRRHNASLALTAAAEAEAMAGRAHSMDMAHLRLGRSPRKPSVGCGLVANGSGGMDGHALNQLSRSTPRAGGHDCGPYRFAHSARPMTTRNNTSCAYDEWSSFAEGLSEAPSGPEVEDPLQMSAWRAALKISLLRNSMETGSSLTRSRAQTVLGGGFGPTSNTLDVAMVHEADVSRHAAGLSYSNCVSSTTPPTHSNTMGFQSSAPASGSAQDPLRRALLAADCMTSGDEGFPVHPSGRRITRRSSMEAAITLAASASRSFTGAPHALPRRTTVGIGTEPCNVRHAYARRQSHSVIGYLRGPSAGSGVEVMGTRSQGRAASALTAAASRLVTSGSPRRLSVSFVVGTAQCRVGAAANDAGVAMDVAREEYLGSRTESLVPLHMNSSMDFDVRRQLLRGMHTALAAPSAAQQAPERREASFDDDENWAEAKGLLPSTKAHIKSNNREDTTAASNDTGRHLNGAVGAASGGDSGNVEAAWRMSVTSASTRDAFNINLTLGELILPGSVGGDLTVARRTVGSEMASSGIVLTRLVGCGGGGGGSIKSVGSITERRMGNSCSGWGRHCSGCVDPGVARMLDVGGVPYQGTDAGRSRAASQPTPVAALGSSALPSSALHCTNQTRSTPQGETLPVAVPVDHQWGQQSHAQAPKQVERRASEALSQLQPQRQQMLQSHAQLQAQQVTMQNTMNMQTVREVSDSAGGDGFSSLDRRPHRWHEVTAAPFADPVTGQRMLLLVQTDVTARVEAERRLVELTAAQTGMLEQMFPRHVLEFVVAHGEAMGEMDFSAHVRDFATTHDMATVLFMDIVGFTTMSKEVPAAAVMTFLSDLYGKLDALVDQYGVWKVETAGDCYIVAAGVVAPDADGFHSVINTEHRTVIDLSPMTTIDNARGTPSSPTLRNPAPSDAPHAAHPASATSASATAAAAAPDPCSAIASSPLPVPSRYGPQLLAFWASEGARGDGSCTTRTSASSPPTQRSVLGIAGHNHQPQPHPQPQPQPPSQQPQTQTQPPQTQQQQPQLSSPQPPQTQQQQPQLSSPQPPHTQRPPSERLAAAGGSAGGKSVGSGVVTGSGAGPSGWDARRDAESVFRFALAALAAAREVSTPHDEQPVKLRVGIHSGPLVSGVIGTKMPKFALFGDTMNTASRMESTCKPGCVQVSATTRSLLPSSLPLTPTGGIEVKGKGVMETFVYDPSPPPQQPLPLVPATATTSIATQ